MIVQHVDRVQLIGILRASASRAITLGYSEANAAQREDPRMLFEEGAASVQKVTNRLMLGELVSHLNKFQRPRPVAVVFETDDSAEYLDVTALTAEDFDVALIALGGYAQEITKQTEDDSVRLTPGSTCLFSARGSLAEGDIAAQYVFLDRNKPLDYQRILLGFASRLPLRREPEVSRTATTARPAAPERPASSSPSPSAADGGAEKAAPPAAPAPSGAPELSFSSQAPTFVSTPEATEALGNLIADTSRALPVVVVTRRYDADHAFVDTAALAGKLTGEAFVVEVTEAVLNWALSSHLGDDEAVFNGAARLFPAPEEGAYRPSPWRFLYAPAYLQGNAQALDRIESDVFGLSYSSWAPTKSARESVEAEVTLTVVIGPARCAIARYEPETSRALCSVHADDLLASDEFSGLPLERLFSTGTRLSGTLDLEAKALSNYYERSLRDAADALASYTSGSTVLARVLRADTSCCEVSLFPGVRVRIDAADVCAHNVRPSDLLTFGQVVYAYVAESGQEGADWLLSLADAEPDEVIPAPALFENGPAWLSPADVERDDTDASDLAAAEDDIPLPDLPADLDFKTRGAIQGVFCELKRAKARNAKLEELLRNEKAKSKRLASSIDDKRASSAAGLNKRYRRTQINFLTDADRLAWETEAINFHLRQTWLERTVPAERAQLALPASWGYGPDFVDTLAQVDVRYDKVLRRMVDVLLGRFQEHEAHQLRSGEGGDDAPRTDAQGNGIWRCYIEQGRPQAARLHYSLGTDGRITFLSVRKHDDYRS